MRLVEARSIASGASGRNGGFALRGGAMPYDRSRETLGSEAARRLWVFTEAALGELAALGGDALRHTGSLRLAADDDEREELLLEYDALRDDGFAAEWRDVPQRGGYTAALFHSLDAAIHPARLVRRLAALAAEAGAEIAENHRVTSLAELDADHVVIATDGYTQGLLPALDAAVRPTRGQVLVTEPLGRQLFPCPHYARRGYDYWQQTPDGRLVLGGRRDASLATEDTAEEATTALIQGELEALAAELVGERPRVSARWAGIWGTTADRLPLAGPLHDKPGVWVAAGYSGHGNVLGFACGRLVADAILGRPAPELALFDPARPEAGMGGTVTVAA